MKDLYRIAINGRVYFWADYPLMDGGIVKFKHPFKRALMEEWICVLNCFEITMIPGKEKLCALGWLDEFCLLADPDFVMVKFQITCSDNLGNESVPRVVKDDYEIANTL